MTEKSNGNSSTTAAASATSSAQTFRPPQLKPGFRVSPPSALRRMRRSIGGTIAYLASWWRY